MRNAFFDYKSKPFLQAVPNATALSSHWKCPKTRSDSALGFSAPLKFFSSHPCFSYIATTPPLDVLSFCIRKPCCLHDTSQLCQRVLCRTWSQFFQSNSLAPSQALTLLQMS